MCRRRKVFIKVFLNRFMLILILTHFFLVTMNNNCNYIIYRKHIDILIFLYYLKSLETFTLIFIYTVSILFTFILHLHFYIYISFHHIGQSHSVLQNHSCMWHLITLNEVLFLPSQQSDGIAGVDCSQVKSYITHWQTIIPDRSQIYAALNLLLLSS